MNTNSAYKKRMQQKKSVMDRRIRAADTDQGILLVNTGPGKGKSSAGFGVVARALGHDMEVAVIQFIKGSFSTGEEAFFRRQENLHYHVMGDGFSWETQDRDQDQHSAEIAWQLAYDYLQTETIGLVMLDELNIVLKRDLLPLDSVLSALRQRPAMQHVIVTGRNAPAELIEIADTVTEMKPIKHAFAAGIRAQHGMEL
ncbi:MAG: cob(I)yrinic acid a,c-diamide adenosyltransferase [Immundisolibacteraceae bacterium]|nr:cob(I)yrinic acid a,c-diamide adenosyltransferase [Immundisolibacteraceae bacterium]